MRINNVKPIIFFQIAGHLEKPKRGLLNILKRKLFQEDDTISITSVISTTSSLATLSSYPSSASLWSTESYSGNFEVPLKQSNFSVEKVENETILQGKQVHYEFEWVRMQFRGPQLPVYCNQTVF